MAKVTFKRHQRTGQYRSFQRHYTDIKIGPKVKIGSISGEGKCFRVSLMVVDDTEKCGWRWIKFKGATESEAEARAWFVEKYAEIIEKHKLFEMPE